jgi:RsiW-degrading membrane proteinase PrsW (M82 family)
LVFLVLAAAVITTLWRYLARGGARVPPRRAGVVVGVGVLFGVGCYFAEQYFFRFTGLSLIATPGSTLGAVLAMFLFAAPLEEAAKVFGLWPLYQQHKITDRYSGLLLGAAVGIGFGASKSLTTLLLEPSSGLLVARLMLSLIAQFFCSGLWGYALGHPERSSRFAPAWGAAVLTHATYDHIVLGRGAGMLVLAVPMTAVMLWLAWSALRDIESHLDRPSAFSQIVAFAEPPPLKVLTRVLQRSERPVMLHWVVIGAFVTAGASIACLAAGVLLGHRLGIDFSLADEADVRSNGPLVLLGLSVLSAFPLSGYLIARASGATSVIEAVLGVLVTLGVMLVALGVVAPIALVFALAVVPVAFALACGGAWFGMGR